MLEAVLGGVGPGAARTAPGVDGGGGLGASGAGAGARHQMAHGGARARGPAAANVSKPVAEFAHGGGARARAGDGGRAHSGGRRGEP